MTDYLNSKTLTVDQIGKRSGKFLLFIRSGGQRPLCLENYAKSDDVIVVLSRYQRNSFPIESDFWMISGGLSKFDSARLFFEAYPEFLRLQYYAFFDPDVGIDFKEIDTLFRLGQKDGKSVYQAAVADGSHTVWDCLYSKGSRGWREVSFVEVMAPFFSHKALMAVVGGFSDSISTWGLEYQWCFRCKNLSMAVYDPITMRHENKVDMADGPFYRYLASMNIDPAVELKTLKNSSVSKFFMECSVPPWLPLWLKGVYVHLKGMNYAFWRRLKSSRLGPFLTRITISGPHRY